MDILLEILLQFVIEIFGQLLFEALAEMVIRIFAKAFGFERPQNNLPAGFGYVALAGVSGYISVAMFPHYFLTHPELRIANLLISPVIVGFLMGLRGRRLMKKQKESIRLDSFAYGFLFAFVFGMVRFWLASP